MSCTYGPKKAGAQRKELARLRRGRFNLSEGVKSPVDLCCQFSKMNHSSEENEVKFRIVNYQVKGPTFDFMKKNT